VSRRSAFKDEMGFPRRIGSADAEQLLSNPGRDGAAPELAEVAFFVGALRAAAAVRPGPGLEASVVPRAAETARIATLEAADRPTTALEPPPGGLPWRRRIAVGAFAIALVPAAMAGLAVAGVTLPEPARDAFESVGIELPNQSEVEDGSSTETKKGRDGVRGKDEQAQPNDAGDESASPATPSVGHPEAGAKNGKQGNGGQNGQSQGRGPESTPPGHGATPPGQGGVPPGQGAPPPGEEVVPPSEGGAPPGQAGTAPGQGQVPPGRGP